MRSACHPTMWHSLQENLTDDVLQSPDADPLSVIAHPAVARSLIPGCRSAIGQPGPVTVPQLRFERALYRVDECVQMTRQRAP